MADPLSIASGIAGLLSLGIQVTQSLITFYSAYKDRDNDLAKISRNLGDLQNIFQSLETAVQDYQSQDNAVKILKQVNKATQGCHEIIKELEEECQKFHREPVTNLIGRIRVAGRHAAYPFRKSTLQKLVEDVAAIRENLSLALDVLQLKSHNQTQYDLSEVKSLLERINTSQLSSTIHNWLKAPDASIDHNSGCTKRHSSTGLWFINSCHFQNWLVEHNSFLWINGFAGCGKSVLCSTAIQHTFHEMKDKHGVGIAFFYFSFNDEAKQNSRGMLCALLLQLSMQLQNGEKHLEQLYESYRSGTPPVSVLVGSLQHVLQQFQEVFILLDALDESPKALEREDVLKVIQQIQKWSLPGLHLLVTSRNHLDIHQSLDPSDGQTLSMRNPEIDQDIADFVSDQLKEDPKLQRWKSRHDGIQEQLTQNAQGVFRYVECQLKELRRARNQKQLDTLLHTLPRDLDETYERILSNIDEMHIDDVHQILTVLCVSTRPLTVAELIDAHAVDLSVLPPCLDRDRLYERDDLVDICLGLIEVSEIDESEINGRKWVKSGRSVLTARIAHFSVQEYLQSERIQQQKVNKFAIRSGSANTLMAQLCLVYLLEPMLSEMVGKFPLAYYAAEHWYHHYINAQDSQPKTEKLLQRLFQHDTNCFNTWIRLYDIDDPVFGKNSYGSPLYYASLLGLESTLSHMLTAYARYGSLLEMVNARGGRFGNALQAASWRGSEKVVQMLLDQGADVNAQGGRYGNALQAASSRGSEKVVQMLLDQGADVNARGGRYGNALQAASWRGSEKVVQMLLDQGADVNAQGVTGQSPSWITCNHVPSSLSTRVVEQHELFLSLKLLVDSIWHR